MKRFTKNDSSFICQNCNREVKPLKYSSRNHCPYCLYSLHVDNFPGDRENECRGLMKPIEVQFNKKGKVLVHKCTKCNAVKKNICAEDDSESELLKIMRNR